jgi:hypothetical protein
MASGQAIAFPEIKYRAVAMMRQALDYIRLDRELVVRSFNTQLEALTLPPRPVIFYPNLRAAGARVHKLAKKSRDAAWSASKAAVWAAAHDGVRDHAWDDAWHATWDDAAPAAWIPVRDSAWDDAWNIAWEEARSDDRTAVWAVARDKALAFARATVWASASDEAWSESAVWKFAAWDGVAWDAAWRAARGAAKAAAWAAALSSSSPRSDHSWVSVSRSFLDILRGGAFFFWTAPDAVHVVLATIRTQEPNRRDLGLQDARQTAARLHCEDGPAIRYEDGSGLFFWNGIQVPDHVILRPDLLRVEMILSERNSEVRRAMIERYGQDRFVLHANATCLDKWQNNELLSVELPNDPDRRLVALKLRCPSTAAVYIIRVPPDQLSVRGALAWSFGLERPEDYVLQRES